uniref:Uncharacterized protein n=1 Tax=Anguilla anguilla TaxID=7936 RepID=A0A0E9S5L0_ANGAN
MNYCPVFFFFVTMPGDRKPALDLLSHPVPKF